ncbi:MAG: DUF86 domain-containing protein [Candidatus Omnitrophica bacterium]|nr:DUF86 domain-containing protein [Candidatus Omnitrophota bacterium]
MPKDDLVRIRHMLDAAKEAVSFTQGKTRSAFEKDRMLVLSLMRLIEVIGEAANQVTGEFQAAHPDIPWAEIVAMRNRLIHAYFDVDVSRVWDTVRDDLPALVASLDKLL